MTNIPDEKILEFCRAAEASQIVFGWNDNIREAEEGVALCVYPKSRSPFSLRVGIHCTHNFKHFSLSKPQVYEDGKWYAATIKNPKTVLPKELKRVFLYNDGIFETLSIRARDVAEFKEHQLTNIRPIPPELWGGEND